MFDFLKIAASFVGSFFAVLLFIWLVGLVFGAPIAWFALFPAAQFSLIPATIVGIVCGIFTYDFIYL